MGTVARADADCDDYARHEGDVGSRPRVRANTHLCASWTSHPRPDRGEGGCAEAAIAVVADGNGDGADERAAHAEWRLTVKVSPKSALFWIIQRTKC